MSSKYLQITSRRNESKTLRAEQLVVDGIAVFYDEIGIQGDVTVGGSALIDGTLTASAGTFGHTITASAGTIANTMTVDTLVYTTLDPPVSSHFSGVAAHSTANQLYTGGSGIEVVEFGTIAYDTDSYTVAGDTFDLPEAGRYEVITTIETTNTGAVSAPVFISLRRAAGTVTLLRIQNPAAATGIITQTLTYNMNATELTDYSIFVECTQDLTIIQRNISIKKL